jgi:hypothetical protein
MSAPDTPWDVIWGLTINLITAGAGAFAGAWGAQLISIRTEKKRRLYDEIVAANAVIGLAVNIANTAIMLKEQQLDRMTQNYEALFHDLVSVYAPRPPDAPFPNFEFKADYKEIKLPSVPIEELRRLIFEQLASCKSAVSLLTPLTQVIESLDGALNKRTEWIKRLPTLPIDQRIDIYFGLPTPTGINTNFLDCISALCQYTDDIIYFSLKMAEQTQIHGLALASQYGQGSPIISQMTFSKAYRAKFLPNRSNYDEIEKAFQSPVATPAAKPAPATKLQRFWLRWIQCRGAR